MPATNGPLAGLRVLDLSSVVVGPVCTGVLAEQGAEVIKLESPEGDLLRKLGGKGRTPGMAGKFLNFNRGKRSVCLNLKHPRAASVLARIAARCDIVVTNMRPDAQKRLGIDAATMTERQPRLIHCSIVGFGTKGPYAGKPAYDTVIQGVSGIAGCFEASTGEPRYMPMVVADHVCGLIAAQQIGFALYRREKTGHGESLEIPMFENMAAFVLQEHLGPMSFRPALGPPGDQRVLSPEGRPLKTADGFIAVSANTDAQAHGFFRAIGRPELIDDPRFGTVAARTVHTKDYFALRATALLGRTSAEWLEMFAACDVPAMPYNTIESLLTDPHLRATGLVREEEHPTEGATFAIAAPNILSGGMTPSLPPAQRLGAAGREVLAEAGLSAQDITELARDGALIQPEDHP